MGISIPQCAHGIGYGNVVGSMSCSICRELASNSFVAKRADHFDDGKPQVQLIDSDWIQSIGGVLAFGARKYSPHNWRKGIEVSRTLGSAVRHVFKYLAGEDIDSESGSHHLAHASVCLMMAHWTATHKPEMDDRWKP